MTKCFIKEREGQMEINQRKKDLEKTLENHYHELTLEQINEADNKQKEKDNEDKEKKQYVKRIIKEQHDQQKAKIIKKIQEDKIEGEIIKRKDIEAQKEQM